MGLDFIRRQLLPIRQCRSCLPFDNQNATHFCLHCRRSYCSAHCENKHRAVPGTETGVPFQCSRLCEICETGNAHIICQGEGCLRQYITPFVLCEQCYTEWHLQGRCAGGKTKQYPPAPTAPHLILPVNDLEPWHNAQNIEFVDVRYSAENQIGI